MAVHPLRGVARALGGFALSVLSRAYMGRLRSRERPLAQLHDPPFVAVVRWVESSRGPWRREDRPGVADRSAGTHGRPAVQAEKGSPEVSTRQPDREDD